VDAALKPAAAASRPVHSPSRPVHARGLLVTALAPLLPQLLGSAFNIWYNRVVVIPLLHSPELRERFDLTVLLYNVVAFPVAVAIWVRIVFSLRPHFHALLAGREVEAAALECARRRVVHLPWSGSLVSGVAWLLCVPVFLGSLLSVGHPLGVALLWHLPISFVVSAFIAVTQSFFLVELASHWGLFPVFFRGARPDQMRGIYPLSLRGRGLMWAISAGICPIGSLMLLDFAPPSPAGHPVWFAMMVGSIGIAFGLCSAVLISRLVAEPVDQLRRAAQAVSEGRFDVQVPLTRADEFGSLIGEFNHMIVELRDKERLRRTFGLHVGAAAAEQILARDPGLSGTEQIITVMFLDIRNFTASSAQRPPAATVAVLNEFLGVMVSVVEDRHHGMINQFLGDGFMAIFGAGVERGDHAGDAVAAAREILRELAVLNEALVQRGDAAIAVGVGLNTGSAIVGSMGSPQRMTFTAIGPVVNVASRIESLTKVVGATILLSDATRLAMQVPVGLREQPPQMVKGVAEPVRVWSVA